MSNVIIIDPDGLIQVDEYPETDILGYLQQKVEGYIERVSVVVAKNQREADMWVNEEGLLRSLPVNDFASHLAAMTHGPGGIIVGTAVLMGSTPDGDSIGLTTEQVLGTCEIAREYASYWGIDITVQ